MLKGKYLVIVVLFWQGFQNAPSRRLFVRHGGRDTNSCGNSTSPCSSVRYAVNISNSGDEILIDYAQGEPYKECESFKQSKCYIVLSKSLSFSGINGKAVIQCKKACNLFKIQSFDFNVTKIAFTNLVISASTALITCSKSSFELVLKHCILKNYNDGVYTKDSTQCSVEAINSSFEEASNFGIWLRCLNLTSNFTSTSFNAAPVAFQTIFDKQKRWQLTEIFISNCVFDGRQKQICADLLSIKPFAVIVNITVESSRFSNHFGMCPRYGRHGGLFYTLQIYDNRYGLREATLMTLTKLLVENNYCYNSAIKLLPAFNVGTMFKAEFSNSIFRNNSGALLISSAPGVRSSRIILLSNNIFQENYKRHGNTYFTAIYVGNCKARVIFCRFLDNMPASKPYAAVVTISTLGALTFENCLFENTQTTTKSLQVYSNSKWGLWFKGNNTFNIIRLKAEQLIVMFTAPYGKFSALHLKRPFTILCPPGYVLTTDKQCTVTKDGLDCSYFYTSCKQCPRKKYSLERGELNFNTTNKIPCHDCPRGGECEGGQVVAKPNFWGYKKKQRLSFLSCPPEYCCDKEDCVSYHGCHGNRTGTLCGQCSEGTSEPLFNTNCKPNEECSSFIFWPGVSFLLILYLLFFLYHREITGFVRKSLFIKISMILRRRESDVRTSSEDVSFQNNQSQISKSSGLLKIIFYYYQIVSLFRHSVGSNRSQHLLGKIEQTFSRILNLIIANIPSFDCPFQNLRPVEKAAILHSIGYCLLVLIAFLYLLTKIFKIVSVLKTVGNRSQGTQLEYFSTFSQTQRITTSPFSVRIVSAFTYISLLMYSSSAQLCLSLLYCVPVGDSQVLFIDGTIKCYQPFQYFLLSYVFFSILPFCLVPILGSYLLKLNRISVFQFCMACILPLPFCCFWMYFLLKNHFTGQEDSYSSTEQESGRTMEEQGGEASSPRPAILSVLLGPFRSHKPLLCFPSSVIPWEGFLIFRRLVLIIVLTFIPDNRLRMIVALIICVAILVCHTHVHPFISGCENFLETLSLSTLIVLCGFTLVKALYQGEDFSSSSNSLSLLSVFNMVEDILIVTPLAVIILIVILSLSIRLIFGFRFCIRVCCRRLRIFCRER